MHARLSCEVRGNHLTLAGTIDEQANLPRLLDHARDQRLVLDLGGVTFINSLGIRSWIRMQQAAEAARLRLELVRVAEPIVHQLNIMPAARGVSIVSSFFAPYICERCDLEQTVLLDVRTHGTDIARKRAPAMTCADCAGNLELAEAPELYFMFLGA
jgi:hypothetical protein